MKHLLEFAKFRDVTVAKDDRINQIMNQSFKNDERLLPVVHFKKENKNIFINWFNTENHKMIDRIKKRTSFNSISEFNKYFGKAIEQLINEHLKEISVAGRYALHMFENNFHFIIEISEKNYENLFTPNKITIFHVLSMVSSPYDVIKIIEINDENF